MSSGALFVGESQPHKSGAHRGVTCPVPLSVGGADVSCPAPTSVLTIRSRTERMAVFAAFKSLPMHRLSAKAGFLSLCLCSMAAQAEILVVCGESAGMAMTSIVI